jgi:hypothetical protein
MVRRMAEAEGEIVFGLGGRPSEVTHRAGHWFMVQQVLCGHGTGTGTGNKQRARPGDAWRMCVFGRLPGDPGRRGSFVLVAEGTGRWPWWLLRQAEGPCDRCGLAAALAGVLQSRRRFPGYLGMARDGFSWLLSCGLCLRSTYGQKDPPIAIGLFPAYRRIHSGPFGPSQLPTT